MAPSLTPTKILVVLNGKGGVGKTGSPLRNGKGETLQKLNQIITR